MRDTTTDKSMNQVWRDIWQEIKPGIRNIAETASTVFNSWSATTRNILIFLVSTVPIAALFVSILLKGLAIWAALLVDDLLTLIPGIEIKVEMTSADGLGIISGLVFGAMLAFAVWAAPYLTAEAQKSENRRN